MTHNQSTTTTTVQVSRRTILDCILRKQPSTRKYYRVTLIVPDNGIPVLEYHQTNASKKPKKTIQFVDLLFADKKHDTNEKYAFSLYTTDKTITFIAQDETTMNEWLSKIKECHSQVYPQFTRYDAVFEATLSDKSELVKTLNIQGPYRLALCKESLDLIPMLTAAQLLAKQPQQQQQPITTHASTTTITTTNQTNAATTTTMASTTTTNSSSSSSTHHHHQQQHNETKLPNSHHVHLHSTANNSLKSSTATMPHSNNHPPHPSYHKRFEKQHPLLAPRIIVLVLRSIRRCGHTDCNFYIESGRHSQIGAGDLWMTLSKKAVARQLHELLLATMKMASSVEDQFIYKPPRSRSGSSSENAHRSQQSRSSSLVCLASEPANLEPNSNNNYNYFDSQIQQATTAAFANPAVPNPVSTIPRMPSTNNNNNNNSNNNNNNNVNNNNTDDDSGYLPMAI